MMWILEAKSSIPAAPPVNLGKGGVIVNGGGSEVSATCRLATFIWVQTRCRRSVSRSETVITRTPWCTFTGKWEDYKRINIDGTEALVRACAAECADHYIYCSLTEARGSVDEIPADEESPLNPSFDYGRSKMIAEDIVRGYDSATMTCKIIPPSGIYGPRNVNDVSYWFIKSFANSIASRFMIGYGSSQVQFVHVEDVVQFLFLSLRMQDVVAGHTYIVSEGRSHSYEEVYGFLEAILGKRMPRIRPPPLLAKMFIAPLQGLNYLLGGGIFMWRLSTVDAVTSDRSYSIRR